MLLSTRSRIPNSWTVVGLLCVVAALNYFDRLLVTTMRPSLQHAFAMSEAQYGLLTSSFLWIYGLASPFAGYVADRFPRCWVVIGSLFAWSALTWLTGQAHSYNELLVARALMGLSEAFYLPAALALIADYHGPASRSRATGVHMSGIMVGSAAGGLGGFLAERFGWQHAFAVFGLIGLGYALVLALFLRDPKRAADRTAGITPRDESPKFTAALTSLFRNHSFCLLIAYWGLFGMVGWLVLGWMPTYLNEHFSLSEGLSGISSTTYLQLASLVGVLAGGAWADAWGRRKTKAPLFVAMVGLAIAGPAILVAANTPSLSIAIGGLVAYGFTRVFADSNMMPILCLVIDGRYRATGYGILNSCSCLVGGLAVYLGGMLRDSDVGLDKIFSAAACCSLGCVALLAFVRIVQPARQT